MCSLPFPVLRKPRDSRVFPLSLSEVFGFLSCYFFAEVFFGDEEVEVFFPEEEAGFLAAAVPGFFAEDVEAGFLAVGFLAEEAGFFLPDEGFLGFSSESVDTSRRLVKAPNMPPPDEDEASGFSSSFPPPSRELNKPPIPEEELLFEDELPPPSNPPSNPARGEELDDDELEPVRFGSRDVRTEPTKAEESPVFFETFFSVSFSLIPPARRGRASVKMLEISAFVAPVFLLTAVTSLLFKRSEMFDRSMCKPPKYNMVTSKNTLFAL